MENGLNEEVINIYPIFLKTVPFTDLCISAQAVYKVKGHTYDILMVALLP